MRIAKSAAAMLALLAALTPARAKDLSVVASIKPVHALASAVMAGAGTPALIVSGNASEHSYALRPSEAKTIADADLVLWIGPMLESFLIRPLSALSRERVMTLIETPGLTLHPFREGGPFESHDDGDGDEHEHEAGAPDGHIWLDPANAAVMARAIAQSLSVRDGPHAALYAKNAAALEARLKALDGALAERLAPLRNKPFIVFHDAYQYLEKRYGLDTAGSVTVNPQVPASAKRVRALRARIEALGAVCLFAEPQFDPKLMASLREGTAARQGVLDPLGADIAPGPEHYFTLMDTIAAALTGCLGP